MRKLLLGMSAVATMMAGPALANNGKNNTKPTKPSAPGNNPAPSPAPAPTPTSSIGNAKAPVACALTDLVPGAAACSGFFEGNLLGGDGSKIAAQVAGLQAIGFAWDGAFGDVTKIDSLEGATSFTFKKTLSDVTYIGLHFGGGGKDGVGNGTAFYKLDLGSGLQEIALKYQGSSGAILYGTGIKPNGNGNDGAIAVPEPGTWAMMIGGFGLLGGVLRRRRSAMSLQGAA